MAASERVQPSIVAARRLFGVAPDGTMQAVNTDGNGNLDVNVTAGGGINASVGANTSTAPTSSTEIGTIDGSGNLQGVSASNPLPITGTVSASNPSVGTNGATAPTSSTEIGVIDGTGKLQGVSSSNPVRIDPVGTTVQPVNGTLTAVTSITNPVTVTQATASNLNAAIVGTKTNNNAAPDATEIGVLPALANALGPMWTENRQVLGSVDLNGGLRTIATAPAESTAAWTSATALNTAVTIITLGYDTVVATFNQTTTLTGGVFSFEVSDTTAFTNAYSVVGIPSSGQAANTYPAQANTNTAFVFNISGWAAFRVRLSTVITGTGTVNVGVAESSATVSNLQTILGSVNVRSTQTSLVATDNRANNSFFTDSGSNVNPMAVGDWVYGGAFSGAADAARQGWSKMRASTVFRTVQATASGNTAVWTPGSGNKFRLLKVFVELTDNASLASGAVLTINLQDATTSINISFDVFVPTTAVTTVIGDGLEQELDLGEFGILSAAANNVLNVNLSAALATGNVRVIAMGTEE